MNEFLDHIDLRKLGQVLRQVNRRQGFVYPTAQARVTESPAQLVGTLHVCIRCCIHCRVPVFCSSLSSHTVW
jgi:hypothetical protein